MLGQDSIARRDRIGHDLFWIADHVLGEERVDTQLRATRDALNQRIQQQLQHQGEGGLRTVDVRDDLSRDEFMERYVSTMTPVVMRGAAASWPCTQKWTPEYFEERFGDDEITLINVSTDDIKTDTYTRSSTTATLRQVIQGMRAGTGEYSRFAPLLESHPELLDDLDHRWLARWRDSLGVGKFYQMFIGGGGTNTALHAAPGSNLFTQIYGRKRWYIYPTSYTPTLGVELARTPFFYTLLDVEQPDDQKYPLFQYAKGWEVVLEEGDVLYVPPFFWHQVHNLTDSIAVGFRWYAPDKILRASATQMLLTMLSTNPPIWVVRQNKANFNKVFARGDT